MLGTLVVLAALVVLLAALVVVVVVVVVVMVVVVSVGPLLHAVLTFRCFPTSSLLCPPSSSFPLVDRWPYRFCHASCWRR